MSAVTEALEVWREPPLFEVSASGSLLQGDHTHKVWRCMTHRFNSVDVGSPMLVKWMSSGQVPLAIELACSMAAQALNLSVPPGALVLCDVDQLTGLPKRISDTVRQVLCFGSAFQFRDDSFARVRGNDASVAEMTWRELCASPQGLGGAAWDELAANADRHHENVVFDGNRWWLIDHERSLQPINKVFKRWAQATARQAMIDHQSGSNRLAVELVRRRPNDHGLDRQARSLLSAKTRITWMADQARLWKTGRSQVDGIFEVTEVVLRSFELRLPALPLYIQKRLDVPPSDPLWNSSSLL
jgi:hypothetical protein